MHIDCLHYKDKRSDKIWGYTIDKDRCIVFYGKTKGTLSFIEHTGQHLPQYPCLDLIIGDVSIPYTTQKARKTKLSKGYVPVLENELNDYLPDSFKEALMLAKLGMGLREAVR